VSSDAGPEARRRLSAREFAHRLWRAVDSHAVTDVYVSGLVLLVGGEVNAVLESPSAAEPPPTGPEEVPDAHRA
jgi:hypothetical protein